MSKIKGLDLTKGNKYVTIGIKYVTFMEAVIMENIDGQPNMRVIPLPKEKECLAILGENGEVTGYLSKTRKNVLGAHWVATFQDGMMWLAQQESMTGEQWRVFAYLLSKLDFDNYLKITQKEIAEKLHMNVKAISRAIKGLKNLDVITEGPMAGHSKTYRFNPRIAHRGAKHYRNTLIEYDDLKARLKKKKDEAKVE